MQQKDNVISICKGIAIILMVMGHTELGDPMMHFIYIFHMPLFFITAGYFFSRKNLDNPWDFCVKRFKGLYVPFVKWSIFFLLLHNVFFHFGILNEQFGNGTPGGVTHPYTWLTALNRLTQIVLSMGGYDEFMAGAFWFFRALLISSIMFLIMYKVLEGKTRWLKGPVVPIIICLICWAFAMIKVGNGIRVVTVVQGGIRETFGILFFGAGMLLHRYEDKIRNNLWLALLSFGVLVAGTYFKCSGMTLGMNMKGVFTLPFTGIAGFIFVQYLSLHIDRYNNVVRRFLTYCGNNTVYVYVFHIISFKLVSLLKIWWYDLEFGQIGCHMVIHENASKDYFWVLYTIVGVGLPLLWIYWYRRLQIGTFFKRLISK